MAPLNGWSHVVDGVELNDGASYFCTVPEIDNLQEQDLILAAIDGDYPVAVRLQPREGQYTFLIGIKAATDALYQARKAQLQALFAYGPHTYTFKVRGMSASKTLQIVSRSLAIDYTTRTATANVTAAKPVPA